MRPPEAVHLVVKVEVGIAGTIDFHATLRRGRALTHVQEERLIRIRELLSDVLDRMVKPNLEDLPNLCLGYAIEEPALP